MSLHIRMNTSRYNLRIESKSNEFDAIQIIDFVSMNRANEQSSDAYGDGDGWHRIAWAFLKVYSCSHSEFNSNFIYKYVIISIIFYN